MKAYVICVGAEHWATFSLAYSVVCAIGLDQSGGGVLPVRSSSRIYCAHTADFCLLPARQIFSALLFLFDAAIQKHSHPKVSVVGLNEIMFRTSVKQGIFFNDLS